MTITSPLHTSYFLWTAVTRPRGQASTKTAPAKVTIVLLYPVRAQSLRHRSVQGKERSALSMGQLRMNNHAKRQELSKITSSSRRCSSPKQSDDRSKTADGRNSNSGRDVCTVSENQVGCCFLLDLAHQRTGFCTMPGELTSFACDDERRCTLFFLLGLCLSSLSTEN